MTRSSINTPKDGFALIIALTVMSFIILLMLSLSTQLQVEISGSTTRRSQEVAKQNALLGLDTALGRLQQTLGPDRRVSARADLLDIQLTTAGESVVQPYWTGVWDDDGTLQTWLVSGNSNDTPLAYEASADPTDAQSVTLFNGTTNEVKIPLVTIQETGAYAYWIADEGIKSKASIRLQNSSQATNANLILPDSNGINQMDGLSWFPDTLATYPRLEDHGSLNILEDRLNTSGTKVLKNRYHDLTPYGFGVLSDSLNGGLKRDLTMALASTATTPSGQIFEPVSGTASNSDPGGPNWSQLRSWANTNAANDLPVRQATDDEVGYFPVIAGFQLYFLPTYDPTTGKVHSHLMPGIVLWNPYTRPLENADYQVQARRVVIASGSSSGINYKASPQDNWYFWLAEEDPTTGNQDYEDTKSNDFEILSGVTNGPLLFNLSNVSLAPGEIQVFTVNGNQAYHSFPSSNQNILSPGYHPGSSFFTPMVTSAGPRTVHTDSAGDPILDYALSLMQQRALAVQLYRTDSGASSELLTDAYYLNATPLPGATNPPPNTLTPFSPNNPQLLSSTQTNGAFGYKFVFSYVDNDSPLLPSARKKWLANHNPRASTMGPTPLDFGGSDSNAYTRNPSVNPSFITMFMINGSEQSLSSVGVGLSERGNISRATLFDSPDALSELTSIGELSHAHLYHWNDSETGNEERVSGRLRNSRFDNLAPAYAIGNSQADPTIELSEVYRDWEDYPNTNTFDSAYFNFDGGHYDYSYLLNQALWDSYFFSTWSASTSPPINTRMVTLSKAEALGPDDRESAARLLVDGAFNVNSTSVEAWKALLSTYFGEDVTTQDGNTDTNPQETPILRYREPLESKLGNGDADSDEAYAGYRTLSPAEVDALAEAIVTGIQERGPFTSLGAFVNRSLTNSGISTHDDRLRGVLAQALLDSGVNSALESYAADPSTRSGYNQDAGQGWRTENIPGWLSQADILARLGSILSVRSDTFRIISYGESLDPISGEVIGKAWCEAIVQRMPEFIDDSNPAHTPMDATQADGLGLDPLSMVNQTFGRRFILVSFRWLSANEI